MKSANLLLVALLCIPLAHNLRAEVTDTNSVDAAVLENAKPKRDPFSPIGYVAPKEVEVVGTIKPPEPEEPVTQWPEVKVIAILLSEQGGHAASIAGVGVVKEGQVFARDVNGVRYTWRIEEITKNNVVPKRLHAKRIR